MTEYLVVYDYTTGGVWGFARAHSRADIANRFPELTIIDQRPAWMNELEERTIRCVSSFVVDDPGTYPEWLRNLLDAGTN